jgi:peptidyl-prolyl cis-trans isomerase SurA
MGRRPLFPDDQPMRTLTALALLPLAAPLAAQTTPAAPPASGSDSVVVEKVVAVVGDTALLLSDVRTRVQQEIAQSGQPAPTDPAKLEQLARTTMDQMVEDMIIVEAARREKLVVADDEVKARVDEQIQGLVQRFGGSVARFDQALAAEGMTEAQYRASLDGPVRDQLLVQQYMREKLQGRARPVISEDQLRAAFAEHKDALGTRPADVSFQQVMIEPQASDSANAAALKTARDVLEQLMKGGDFAVLAKRYSDDPGTKEQGGSLGWFKQGRMVKPFEDAVFAMRPGQTSGIVKTEFGYHIIRLDKVRGPEREARHILIKPEINEADIARARVRADSVATAIRGFSSASADSTRITGGASVAALAKQYGTKPEESDLAHIPIANLPPAYTEPLKNAKPGDVVGPIQIDLPSGTTFAVVKVTSSRPEGEYTLDDVRTQLTEQLQQQKMMDQLLQDLKRQTFVNVLM